jgi:hypothetical protein
VLDKGTDIKYIKDLSGHFNIKTTERYLHVSKKQLVNIVSPLDDLWNKEEINWQSGLHEQQSEMYNINCLIFNSHFFEILHVIA